MREIHAQRDKTFVKIDVSPKGLDILMSLVCYIGVLLGDVWLIAESNGSREAPKGIQEAVEVQRRRQSEQWARLSAMVWL